MFAYQIHFTVVGIQLSTTCGSGLMSLRVNIVWRTNSKVNFYLHMSNELKMICSLLPGMWYCFVDIICPAVSLHYGTTPLNCYLLSVCNIAIILLQLNIQTWVLRYPFEIVFDNVSMVCCEAALGVVCLRDSIYHLPSLLD